VAKKLVGLAGGSGTQTQYILPMFLHTSL